MARNLSVAMGRPLPAFRFRTIVRDVVETIGIVVAAGRVASAVESHRVPSTNDLERLGLADAPQMKARYWV